MELLVVSTVAFYFIFFTTFFIHLVSLSGHVSIFDRDVVFQMHMEEPCFDFLRTKETLGWVSPVMFLFKFELF